MPDRPELGHLDWIAFLDQVTASVKDMAPILHSYYEALCDTGFTRGEALMLTSRFQTELMTPPPEETH